MKRRQFVSLAAGATAVMGAPAWISSAAAQDVPGLSAKAITIASSCPVTGPLSGFGTDIQLGAGSAFAAVNARGGIHGRGVQMQMLDDAYVPERTLSNVKQVLSDGSAMALFSCLGTPNIAGILPLVEEAGTPLVAPITGASSLRKNSRNVFHVRASYSDETQRLIKRMAGMGLKSIGVIHLDNGFGRECNADAQRALTEEKMKPAMEAALATNGSNLDAVLQQVAATRPAALLLATAGVVSIDLVRGLRKHASGVLLAGLSVTMSGDSFTKLGDNGSGLALTMIVPDPNRTRIQLVRDYQAAMRAKGHNDFTQGSLEAYVNARVLIEGLERAGKDPSPAKLRAALVGIKQWDLGGFTIDYSAQAPYVGSRFIDLGVLGNGGRFLG